MQTLQVIPILRIFDYQKAIEFYIEWLGFKIDWEHRFEPNTPVYMQISKDNFVIHLSEHHGDTTPGSKVFLTCTDIIEYHEELIDKKYKYNRPGIGEAFYGALCFEVIDPFHNKISFNEYPKDKNE
jgi:uncharacterized glyoxalase superfamily protein PhnB